MSDRLLRTSKEPIRELLVHDRHLRTTRRVRIRKRPPRKQRHFQRIEIIRRDARLLHVHVLFFRGRVSLNTEVAMVPVVSQLWIVRRRCTRHARQRCQRLHKPLVQRTHIFGGVSRQLRIDPCRDQMIRGKSHAHVPQVPQRPREQPRADQQQQTQPNLHAHNGAPESQTSAHAPRALLLQVLHQVRLPQLNHGSQREQQAHQNRRGKVESKQPAI